MSPGFLPDSLHSRPLDISGIENAILDVLVMAADSDVEALGLTKGTMKLVEPEEQGRILEAIGNLDPEVAAGGSGANALRVASRLGSATSYSSAVGFDENGNTFSAELVRHGVRNRLARVDGLTATSVILVTPDGERTMNTHLGVCRDYCPAHVSTDDIEQSKLFFTTGYVWDSPNQIEAIESALGVARGAGVKLALDLADPFVVERSREVIEEQLDRGLDVVFTNAEEARILTGSDPVAATRELSRRSAIAVVTAGAEGAYLGSGDELIHVPARRVEVLDTTGAGDCFAAGFLHGLATGLSLRECGELATLLAADTITQLGVKITDGTVAEARQMVAEGGS